MRWPPAQFPSTSEEPRIPQQTLHMKDPIAHENLDEICGQVLQHPLVEHLLTLPDGADVILAAHKENGNGAVP